VLEIKVGLILSTAPSNVASKGDPHSRNDCILSLCVTPKLESLLAGLSLVSGWNQLGKGSGFAFSCHHYEGLFPAQQHRQ